EAVLLELEEAAGAATSSIAALAGAMPMKEALAAVARPATLMENFLFRRDRSASCSAFSASMRARRVVKVMLLLSIRRKIQCCLSGIRASSSRRLVIRTLLTVTLLLSLRNLSGGISGHNLTFFMITLLQCC